MFLFILDVELGYTAIPKKTSDVNVPRPETEFETQPSTSETADYNGKILCE